ncbi:MAG: hypothetical protein V1754_02260, partial [Pseudomonadota bacterium]
TLVEMEHNGTKVSQPPEAIPGLGPVTTTAYVAQEMCGVVFLDRHEVKNAIGRIYRWAIEAMLTALSCSRPDIPCYTSLNAMFDGLIDCVQLESSVNNQYAGWGTVVKTACMLQKQMLVTALIHALDNMATTMTYMSLSAKVDIANDTQMANGRWYGTLGGALGKGNFEGTFTARRK